MKLIIGGYGQGKLQYVRRTYRTEHWYVAEACLPDVEEQVIINHFHLWVREMLKENAKPEEKLAEYLQTHKDCIFISDEIGNGLVPMDAFERAYRERTGRMLIAIAQQAEEVVRVICGMGQKIK